MAESLVQDNYVVNDTPTVSITSTPTSGNILISVMSSSAGDPVVTSVPTGWTLAATSSQFATKVYIAYKVSDGTETEAAWTTDSTSGNTTLTWVGEYSGLTGSAPNVTSATATGSGLTLSSGTTATTSADCFAFAAWSIDRQLSVDDDSSTFTNSFTEVFSPSEDFVSGLVIAGGSNTSATTAESTITFTGTSDQICGAMMVWELASTAAGNPWNYYAQQG